LLMSRDNYDENPQEAAIRTAFSMFNHGMYCMNRCMEEYSNFLKLSNYLAKSYSDVLYGGDVRSESPLTSPKTDMEIAQPMEKSRMVIPIHEIKETTYVKKQEDVKTDSMEQTIRKN